MLKNHFSILSLYDTMDLLERFVDYWKQNFAALSITKQQYLVAVSGGIDSSVLVHLMHCLDMDFELAHCNFKLRGEESERDELFVKTLADKYNRKLHLKRFDTNKIAIENKTAIQETARKIRYDWFKELTTTSFLITAHNADDNVETFLMNASRGTGLQGLTGIQNINLHRRIIRPLLFAFRKDISLYAASNHINWVEDSSNTKEDYTRNFFRHQIIPLIQQQYTTASENIAATIERLHEVNVLYQTAVVKQKEKLLLQMGKEIHIPILKLLRSNAIHTITWEIFKEYNFSSAQINEILKLMHAENASYIQSATHRVIKNRKWLIVTDITSTEHSLVIIEQHDAKIHFPSGNLQFELLEGNINISADLNIAMLDADLIQYPLILRKWKQGDYFYPLGMKKKKKLSRFMIDQKLSSIQKENVWVLEANKSILWVIGYRIDDRFKIAASTAKCIKITYANKP